MFDSLKKFINEFERIVNKGNTTEDFTDEEKSFLEYADILLALALLETDGCDIRKVAKTILVETEDL